MWNRIKFFGKFRLSVFAGHFQPAMGHQVRNIFCRIGFGCRQQGYFRSCPATLHSFMDLFHDPAVIVAQRNFSFFCHFNAFFLYDNPASRVYPLFYPTTLPTSSSVPSVMITSFIRSQP